MMIFNLRDTETSNQFGQFEDEREVLILVRTLVGHYGDSYADELGLGRVTDEGKVLEPLTGGALLARANEVLGERHPENQPEREETGGRIATAGRTVRKRADELLGNRRLAKTVHASGQHRPR